MRLMAAVKICYLPGLVLRIPAEFSCSGNVISSRLKEVPCQSGYLATGIFSTWVGSSIKISSNHTHNTVKNSNVSPRVVLKDFLRGLFWNVMVTFKVSWIKLYVHWMQWKSSLGLTWIIKNLKGDIRVGKRKNWWMRNNCTRPTAGLEKTREFQLGLWASSSHISDILLSQGHFLVFFVNLFC